MATTADMVPTVAPTTSAADVFPEEGLGFLGSVASVVEDEEGGVDCAVERPKKKKAEVMSVLAVEEELVITGLDAGRIIDVVSVAIVVSVVVGSDFVVPVVVVVVWSLVVKESLDSSTDSLS